MLWMIPLTDSNRPLFERWYRAGQAMGNVVDAYLQNISSLSGDLDRQVIPSFEKIYPLFQEDPFLRSFYWENMADFQLKGGHPRLAIQSLWNAVGSGCPSAHLFFRLGVLNLGLQDRNASREAFLLATKAPQDFTQARSFLPGGGPEMGR